MTLYEKTSAHGDKEKIFKVSVDITMRSKLLSVFVRKSRGQLTRISSQETPFEENGDVNDDSIKENKSKQGNFSNCRSTPVCG